jgi:hypothetical protein
MKQIDNWRNVFQSHVKKAFKKVRIKNNPKDKVLPLEVSNLIDLRNQLVINEDNTEEINRLNAAISDIEAEINHNKIMKHFQSYSENPERINIQQVWKTMNKLWPKVESKLPAAKKNHKGQIISEPNQIKNLLAKEYKERLRARPIRPDFDNLEIRNFFK